MNKYKTPFYIMFHPIEGYMELLYHKWQSVFVANIIALVYFAALVIERQLTGFLFNPARLENLNILNLMVQSIGLSLVFCGVNWSVCTLFDGKGMFKNIWVVINYSLVPYIFSVLIVVIMSNILKSDERMFMTIVISVGVLWSAFLLIKGLEAIHEYNIPQTLFSIISTFIGMAVVAFLSILLLSLSQQMIGFVITIAKELMLRQY